MLVFALRWAALGLGVLVLASLVRRSLLRLCLLDLRLSTWLSISRTPIIFDTPSAQHALFGGVLLFSVSVPFSFSFTFTLRPRRAQAVSRTS